MFWTGFAIGIFLGATIGAVVAGLLAASSRDEEKLAREDPLVFDVVMDEVTEASVGIPKAPRPATHLDDYPSS